VGVLVEPAFQDGGGGAEPGDRMAATGVAEQLVGQHAESQAGRDREP
jgi:hypothetical protein